MYSEIIYSTSFLSFLRKNSSGSKIAFLLRELCVKRYSDSNNIANARELNYLTNRKDGTISYLPRGKEHKINEVGEWSKDGRQDGKPAKVIRKLFTDKFIKKYLKDIDFEIFTNLYKSEFLEGEYQFKLLDNNHIVEIYNHELMGGEGSLQGSCMNGDGNYLAIYTNCKVLKILALFNLDGSKLVGRALVWQVDNGVLFMDRIYVTKDYQHQLFLNFAKERNWLHKLEYKTYNNKTSFVDSEGNIFEKTYRIETSTDFCYYPYIDTFSYGGDGYLINSDVSQYEYNCTNGERTDENNNLDEEDEERYYCEYNEEYFDEYEVTYICSIRYFTLQYAECYIRERNVIRCFFDDNIVHDVCDNDEHIRYVQGNYYHNESNMLVYCECTSDTELIDNCTEIDGGWYLTADCTEIDGGWYLTADCTEIDGGWYLTEDCTEIDGDWYLTEDCTEIDGLMVYLYSEEYKTYKKLLRRNKRNKLGRKHTKKVKL